MDEVDAGLRGDVGETCTAQERRSARRPPAAPRAARTRRNARSKGLHRTPPSADALVIVDRLPLVVVLRAQQAPALPVIACDDSSALKRRKSFSSRAGVRRRRPGRGSRASACSASAHLPDRPGRPASAPRTRLGVLALQEQNARRSGSAPRGRADTSRGASRSECKRAVVIAIGLFDQRP